MRNDANKIISVYTGDTSGVCSALYELDGMTVMHDASGCNSTYNTHDEPRWYEINSRVYLSGITEYEAILGDEEKLINDCVTTCKEQKPKFVALAPTPIPFVMGQDIKAVASTIEKRTSIPSFGIETNGMHSYINGAGIALLEWAKRFVKNRNKQTNSSRISVNILGITPLDYPRYDLVDSIICALEKRNLEINSVWSMGKYTSNMELSANADVNLVVSSVGLPVAKYLEETFHIPYIIGVPFGEKQSDEIANLLKNKKTNVVARKNYGGNIAIIGESVFCNSLAKLIGQQSTVISLLPDVGEILSEKDLLVSGEEELENKLKEFDIVIGDPLFKYLVDSKTKFIDFPHFAFSGRIYTKNIPNISDKAGDIWSKEILK